MRVQYIYIHIYIYCIYIYVCGIGIVYRLYTSTDGAMQNETVSAKESNSTPNFDEIPSNRAIFPSKISIKPASNINNPALKYSFFIIKIIAINPRNILSIVREFGKKRFFDLWILLLLIYANDSFTTNYFLVKLYI